MNVNKNLSNINKILFSINKNIKNGILCSSVSENAVLSHVVVVYCKTA